ncbi:uncharacterized protein LOC121739247 [Aricia agestis]|uniref:uncharacterized protein LOC121739247 n=1 Tax=Aricia agestis TaxID=91739 RepID=UPI001C208751|nr:uncharacterized protein LOC121739247 [Aricia agestis]
MRTALCVLAALAALRPAPALKRLHTMDVHQAYNHTVCPFVPVIDEDENRLPRRIMTWKCADDTRAYCRASGVPDDLCCHHYHRDLAFECVELFDTTTVTYQRKEQDKVRFELGTVDVPVGCVCGVSTTTPAGDLPSYPERRAGLPGPVSL